MKAKENVSSHSNLLLSSRQYFVEMVENGLSKTKMRPHAAVQNYLVELLEHYLDAKNLPDQTTLAEMYLTASSLDGFEKHDLLKKLGDRTLYISGFFGDSLNRKLVDIEYYAEMGGAAYSSLADISKTSSLIQVYRTFSQQFLNFVDVLTYISQQTMVQSDQNVLRLYDRYMQTGSQVARDKLLEMGFLTLPIDQKKLIKQD